MADGFTEIVIIIGGMLFGWPLPLLAVQILWVNLISDGFPNIALTLEKGDEGIMTRKPVSPKKSILDYETKFLIILISTLSGILALGIFYWVWKTTGNLDMARTMTFGAVAVNSLLYVFSCRSTSSYIWQRSMFINKYLIVAVFSGFVLQLIAMYLPFFQNIFQTVSLGIVDWLIIFSVGIIDIFAIELTKYFFIGRSKRAAQQQLATKAT